MRSRALTWARSMGRRLHHVRWRDQKIDALAATVSKTKAESARVKNAQTALGSVDVPSFRRYVFAERRINALMHDRIRPDRGNLVTRKLKSYSFAQSHGVDTPELIDIWDHLDDIDWDGLPDAVVIKTNGGTASRGVVPLRRTGDRWTIVTGNDTVTHAEIVDRLRAFQDEGLVTGPYFAEELLPGADTNALPVDVKIYGFYGEVGLALLRSVQAHDISARRTFRCILPDGTDLGHSCPEDIYDSGIPIPDNLEELFVVAKRLSLGVPRAFVRVDLYDIAGRIVFGEFTPRPGGTEDYGPEFDAQLGCLWERAHSRVLNDAIDGAGYGLRFGPGPRELRLSQGSWGSRKIDPGERSTSGTDDNSGAHASGTPGR